MHRLNIITKLIDTLQKSHISFCHWKSNESLQKVFAGLADLDLLVARHHATIFQSILWSLGFKHAQRSFITATPNIIDYYGFDYDSGQIVHVHAHFALIVGLDFIKNYHIPIERQVLNSVICIDGLPCASPEYEFILFVLRMVLKHFGPLSLFHSCLNEQELNELTYLEERICENVLSEILSSELKFIEEDLFHSCRSCLSISCGIFTRLLRWKSLTKVLQPYSRSSLLASSIQYFLRRLYAKTKRAFFALDKKRLVSGGLFIGLLGGDGAGKTTVVKSIQAWLGSTLAILNVHLGKPPVSVLSRFVVLGWQIERVASRTFWAIFGGILKEQPLFGFSNLFCAIRMTCLARDRYYAFSRARRFRANGGIVISDRYYVPELYCMDGPKQISPPVSKLLITLFNKCVALEKSYYSSMLFPDAFIILMLSPELAVSRRPESDETQTRGRNQAILNVDWSKYYAHTINAALPKEEVILQVKAKIWEML